MEAVVGGEEREGGGGTEDLTAACQIRDDFINSSCCFQETSLEGNIVGRLECVGGGCLPSAASTTSKIAACKEITNPIILRGNLVQWKEYWGKNWKTWISLPICPSWVSRCVLAG